MNVSFCLLDADYVGNTIRLYGVTKEGKSVIVIDNSFSPYLYALSKSGLENKLSSNMIKSVKKVKKTFNRETKDFLQIFVDLPQNVSKVRDIIKKHTDCYEYTINFYKRYLIDKKFYPLDWINAEGESFESRFDVSLEANVIKKIKGKEPKIKALAFDLEFVDEKIVMISIAMGNFQKLLTYKKTSIKDCEVLKDEKSVLMRFQEIICEKDPDVLLTYNGDAYDFEVLSRRVNVLKVDLKLGRDDTVLKFMRRARISSARIAGRIHIDLFNFINKIIAPQLQSEILTLNDISRELIGEGKEVLSLEEIIDLWSSGKTNELGKYCINDSVLTKKLGDIMLPQIFELSRTCGQLPFDCSRLTYGLLVEWYLLRKAHEQNIVAPNQPHWNEIEKRRMISPYKGGYVKEPKQGLHSNIAVFDFRSLYPSIIVTFNISPETLSPTGFKVPGLKYSFCKKPVGFIPKNLKCIIEERVKIKHKLKFTKNEKQRESINKRQDALKILANATYGYLAYHGARWYSRECAESAAAFGRDNIKKTIKIAEKEGFEVIYADTDSLFVKSKNIGKKSVKFLDKINKSLPGMLELNLQGIYLKGLFVQKKIGSYTAKKRYALIDRNKNLTIRGLETVRRDWCDIARNLQHDVIRLVLTGKEKEAVKKVKDVVKKISSRKVKLKDIAIRTMLGKPLEEYKQIGPHVVVAQKLKKQGHRVHQGMMLSYIITKNGKSISDRSEPLINVSIKDYDIGYYLNNQIISVALRILSALGYKEVDFLHNGLERFVKK